MAYENKNNDYWDIVVQPKSTFFQFDFKELWAYRDLILLMVKRDLTAVYKQTILGPLWMFIQPIFITIIYNFTFQQAKLSTDHIPSILFYLVGQTFWVFFADCLTKTSNTFISNAAVFGKVYFPRLVMPISIAISNFVKLGIQISLLAVFYFYYLITTDDLQPHWIFFPAILFFILLLCGFGLSLGILFSSVTTKYRDFNFLITFAVQLFMFLSCVIFPATMFSGTKQFVVLCNPVAGALEAIKYVLTGHGTYSVTLLLINSLITILFLILSVIMFNRTEKSFMDTV
ncbi:MAG: ABC transporter permease [bacterium]|nr:ABC transporter permease [bacterium]